MTISIITTNEYLTSVVWLSNSSIKELMRVHGYYKPLERSPVVANRRALLFQNVLLSDSTCDMDGDAVIKKRADDVRAEYQKQLEDMNREFLRQALKCKPPNPNHYTISYGVNTISPLTKVHEWNNEYWK